MNSIHKILKTVRPRDFVPPIIRRITDKFTEVINRAPIHPFDCIPMDISPRWFLDIEANIRDVTKAALKTYPQCKAICFEQIFDTYVSLDRNLNHPKPIVRAHGLRVQTPYRIVSLLDLKAMSNS